MLLIAINAISISLIYTSSHQTEAADIAKMNMHSLIHKTYGQDSILNVLSSFWPLDFTNISRIEYTRLLIGPEKEYLPFLEQIFVSQMGKCF